MREKSLIKQRRESQVQVKTEKKPSKLEKSFATISNTEEGLQVLTMIAETCGWQNASIPTGVDGKIDSEKSLVQVSKRIVWAGIRRYIPADRLVLIEHPVHEEESK